MDPQMQSPGMMGHGPDQQQPDMSAQSYYPTEPNDLTGGLPINLDSLRDGPPGSKPFYPYSTLIRCVVATFWLFSGPLFINFMLTP
jgi:forkhead box protein J2/3